MNVRRVLVVVVVAAVVVALVAFDKKPSSTDAEAGAPTAAAVMPVATSPHAPEATYYCAGGTAATGAIFDATIVIANANDRDVDAVVTAYPGATLNDNAGIATVAQLQPKAKTVTVPARSRGEVHVADIQPSPYASTTVEIDAGDVAVERRVAGKFGSATSPCSSSASATWFFPVAVTTKDATATISLFNPFPADAVVDVTFATSDGFRAPPALQGLPIPGRQLAVVDLSVSVPLLAQIATTVATRSGQVIADELQSFDGSDPAHPAGVNVHAGAPVAAPVWSFPEGGVTDGVNETFTIMNPTDATVVVLVAVALDDPQTNGAVDPISLTIAPRTYGQIVMKDQTRIPQGVAHSVVVRSRTGNVFVPERVITGGPPSSRRGYSATIGSPVVSTRWFFPDGRAVPNDTQEFLIAQNPRPDVPVQLSVVALSGGRVLEINSAAGLQVPPGGRSTIDLTQVLNQPNAAVVVSADHPVIVERGLFAANGAGLGISLGLPAVDQSFVLV